MRFTGHFLIEVLVDSGDITAALRTLANSLASAREAGDLLWEASCLSFLADLDLRAGDTEQSEQHLRAAIEIYAATGAQELLTRCLDLCGYLCAARSQWADAVTIWAAYKACRQAGGALDTPLNAQRRREPQRKAVRALGPALIQAAEQRGAAMPPETAAEYAVMLSDAHVQAPPAQAAPSALTSLSRREQELVTLVAKGRTDAQIASQLFISISTVRSHLDRIRDKTSCRRRADLTRLALQAGLA